MGQSELCKECLVAIARMSSKLCLTPDMEKLLFLISHCHHEPKEKQKCWCEGYGKGEIKLDVARMVDFTFHGRITAPVYVRFCPECGRKLNER